MDILLHEIWPDDLSWPMASRPTNNFPIEISPYRHLTPRTSRHMDQLVLIAHPMDISQSHNLPLKHLIPRTPCPIDKWPKDNSSQKNKPNDVLISREFRPIGHFIWWVLYPKEFSFHLTEIHSMKICFNLFNVFCPETWPYTHFNPTLLGPTT